jgi:branched-subunit amino acid ABC-type transport system permease component
VEIFFRTLFVGVVAGSVYALASTGLVLTYRTSGVLNLGYGAVALLMSFVHWQLAVVWGWPVWLSAIVVILVVAPIVGALLDIALFRRLVGQPPVILIICTVGLWVLLQGIVIFVWGSETETVPSLFPTDTVGVFGARIGVDQIAILVIALGAAGTLAAFLRFTRWGIALRAVVDNREVAGLMGVNSGLVSAGSWALGTSFAAMTGVLLTPQLLLDPNLLPPFIISFVLGAAIVGYLRSLALAFAGGILVGLIQAFLIQYGTFSGFLGSVTRIAPFLVLIVLILFAPRSVRRVSTGASFVVRIREVADKAPPGAAMAVGAVVFGVLALLPILVGGSVSWLLAVTAGLVNAIVFLSLVILTGYSGQISLGHTAFMGIAAFTTAHLVSGAGLPVWVAFGLGALAAVPVGALIGLIAVRLHGLFLALMTLAFAFVTQELFFNKPSVSGVEGSVIVPRPPGAESHVAFFYLVVAVLGLCALLAVSLRTGRTGRVLAAMRDSETATRALGINVVKYKAIIFGLSAFMGAVGGILFAMIRQAADRLDFLPFYSLIYVTLAVIGGLFHVGGAIVAGLLFGLYPKLFGQNELMLDIQLILFGVGATLALAREPEGMFGELRRGGAKLLTLVRRERKPAAAETAKEAG